MRSDEYLIPVQFSWIHVLLFTLTQSQLLPGVRGQREAQHRHGGDQEARHDQVGEVVQGPPPDLDVKGDVKIRLGTAVVNDFIPISRNSWKQGEQGYKVNHEVFFVVRQEF